MIKLVENFIKKYNLIDKNKKIIVGCSTGVDSSVLLNILIKLNYDVIIAHINHNVREESKTEFLFLQEFAKTNNIIFESIVLDTISEAFEENARNERYKFFKAIAKKYNTNQIATAHHLDDNLETILMKITRGSNLYGYSGIKNKIEIDGFIIFRPLLCVDKAMIYDFANKNEIKYFEDYTNTLDDHTRNRFRHHILPLIKKENPNIYKSSIQYSNQLLNAYNYIRSITSKLNPTVIEFNELDEALKFDYISMLLEKNNIDQSYEKIENITNLLSSKNPNIKIDIGNGLAFIKAYNSFKIAKEDEKINETLEITDFGVYEFGDYIVTFTKNIANVMHKHIRLCYNNIEFPLKIRNRLNGDSIKLSFGKKKIKDIFIDKKIPMEQRDKIPLLINGDGSIIGILGITQIKQDCFDCCVCFERKEK